MSLLIRPPSLSAKLDENAHLIQSIFTWCLVRPIKGYAHQAQLSSDWWAALPLSHYDEALGENILDLEVRIKIKQKCFKQVISLLCWATLQVSAEAGSALQDEVEDPISIEDGALLTSGAGKTYYTIKNPTISYRWADIT